MPVFLPGESHGQRSLAGYSPECCKGRTQLNDQAQAHWPSRFQDEKTNRKSKEPELYFHFFSILFSNMHSFSRFFHSCWVILHFTKLDTAWNHLGQIPITTESPITNCQVPSICFSPLLHPGFLYGGSLGVATWDGIKELASFYLACLFLASAMLRMGS